MEKETILNELRTIELKLWNHKNAEVRHGWAAIADDILGKRSVWEEVDNLEELRSALERAKSMLDAH